MGRDDADLVEDLVRGGVHAMGAQSLFQCSTNDSIALLSTFTELNVPHRITFRVMTGVPDLDLIHPRRTGGSEVENDSPPLLGEPLPGVLRQVHGSIVQDDMDLLPIVGGDDLVHQPEEIRRRVSLRQ